jgi:indole-3-glycerol phosphate synthase
VATVAAIARPDITGVDAILVGEALVTAADVPAQVRVLAGLPLTDHTDRHG